MKEFIEKWNTDSRFKTKTKLGLYTLFVIIVAVFAFSTRGTVSTTPLDSENDIQTNNTSVKVSEKYDYLINVTVNEKKYKYSGSKDQKSEIINKTANETTTKYIYKDNQYYQEIVMKTNIVSKEEIYDIIEYNYLNIDTINKYLSISKEDNGKYLVYLKDIILGSESQDYITITIDKNKTIIDYTSLMKVFDKTIENSIVEIIIDNKE